MESKKSSPSSLESRRVVFFALGMGTAAAIALLLLEFTSYEVRSVDAHSSKSEHTQETSEEEEIIDVEEEQPAPEPEPLLLDNSFDQAPTPEVAVTTQVPSLVVDGENLEQTDVEIEGSMVYLVNPEFASGLPNIVPPKVNPPEPVEVLDFPTTQAQFPGGLAAMYEFLSHHIRYPNLAKQAGIQGRVFVQFVVWKDGSIGEVKTLHGIGGGCDEEALRVVGLMPSWEPAEMAGVKVASRFTLPIHFVLK